MDASGVANLRPAATEFARDASPDSPALPSPSPPLYSIQRLSVTIQGPSCTYISCLFAQTTFLCLEQVWRKQLLFVLTVWRSPARPVLNPGGHVFRTPLIWRKCRQILTESHSLLQRRPTHASQAPVGPDMGSPPHRPILIACAGKRFPSGLRHTLDDGYDAHGQHGACCSWGSTAGRPPVAAAAARTSPAGDARRDEHVGPPASIPRYPTAI